MSLTEKLFEIANLGAEWVLWILLLLSLLSVSVIAERTFFLIRRRFNIRNMQIQLAELLENGRFEAAQKKFQSVNTMEAQVLQIGLCKHALGVQSVEELMCGTLVGQKQLYQKRLSFLATVGSNAPFIGLFGTVLGIIQAFAVFDINGGPEASAGIMAAISEALVATGVGLLVAIPAVITFNIFNTKIKQACANTEQLTRTLLAYLSAVPAATPVTSTSSYVVSEEEKE